MKSDKPNLLDLLGLRNDIDFHKVLWIIQVFALVVIVLVALLLFEFFKAVAGIGVLSDQETQSLVVRNVGLAVAAVVGVPFLVWRSIVAQKQVDVAEQGHITDRINKAVEGLGAEKTVSRVWHNVAFILKDVTHTEFEGREDSAVIPKGATEIEYGRWEVANRTKPNLEVRIGAIYALERIAQDSDRDHIQVMEILCAYIRQNAPDTLAQPLPEEWQNAFEASETDSNSMPSAHIVQQWARSLPKPREDIQVTLTVLGRRTLRQIALEGRRNAEGKWIGYRLDLRSTCLQNAHMSAGRFEHARFNHAQMQGVNLSQALTQAADLREAQMQGANLVKARMQGAVVLQVQMQGADLSEVRLSKTDLRGLRARAANLSNAELQEADLSHAKLQNAKIWKANLQLVKFVRSNCYRADFSGSKMQGVYMRQIKTLFSVGGDNFRGASLRFVDLSKASVSQAQLDELFGDRYVKLPKGMTLPDRNEIGAGENSAFDKHWRAWQLSIGFDPDDPKTW